MSEITYLKRLFPYWKQGMKLQSLMQERAVFVKELADAIGRDEALVMQFTSGQVLPHRSEAAQIAAYLRVLPEFFYEDIENGNDQQSASGPTSTVATVARDGSKSEDTPGTNRPDSGSKPTREGDQGSGRTSGRRSKRELADSIRADAARKRAEQPADRDQGDGKQE